MRKVPMSKLHGKIHVKHGFAFKGEYFTTEGEHVLLTPGNFLQGGGFTFNPEKAKYYTGEFPSSYICNEGDLIVAMTEQMEGLLGCTAIVPQSGKFLHNQRIGLITIDESCMDKMFVYYLFNTKSVRKQIRGSSSGTKVKHTSPDRMYDVLAPLPPLSVQKGIGKLLSALDAKITLNQRINAELEAMAKLLYDYWFVQFDFPISKELAARLGKPKLEGKPYKSSGGPMVHNAELKREVPEGWEVDELGDHLTIERGIGYTSAELSDQGTPLINLDSFTLDGRYKVNGLKYYTGTVKEGKYLKPGDLMIAATDVTRNAHIIGRSFILPDIFSSSPAASTDIAKVNVGPTLNKYVLQMLFNTTHYHKYIKGFASGTLVLHLNMDGLKWYKTPIAPIDLQLSYERIKEPNENKAALIIKENHELSTLRDWLLPMLMNGQVTVGAAEEEVGLAMAAEPAGKYGKKRK
ncbi:MAG: restriction endonuclease subunit S [Flavobacteriales bacterium]|nr:restriction endonuclease subunit S [Flavobacteriales bacterium]